LGWVGAATGAVGGAVVAAGAVEVAGAFCSVGSCGAGVLLLLACLEPLLSTGNSGVG
jgi:hypothetical protein